MLADILVCSFVLWVFALGLWKLLEILVEGRGACVYPQEWWDHQPGGGGDRDQ